jgi:hypothetical protein
VDIVAVDGGVLVVVNQGGKLAGREVIHRRGENESAIAASMVVNGNSDRLAGVVYKLRSLVEVDDAKNFGFAVTALARQR